MIIGMGADLVDIRRIERLLARHGPRFLEKIFTPAEQEAARGRGDGAAFLARRFAAKEAAAKALGTGFRSGVGWRDIEVVRGDLGAPCLALHGGAQARLVRIVPDGYEAVLHLSLSDEPPYALAWVIIEARPLPQHA